MQETKQINLEELLKLAPTLTGWDIRREQFCDKDIIGHGKDMLGNSVYLGGYSVGLPEEYCVPTIFIPRGLSSGYENWLARGRWLTVFKYEERITFKDLILFRKPTQHFVLAIERMELVARFGFGHFPHPAGRDVCYCDDPGISEVYESIKMKYEKNKRK